MALQPLRRSVNRTGDVGANKFQETTRRTRTPMSTVDMLVFGKDGSQSEFGEVMNVIYKHLWQGHPLDTEKLKLEMGDLLWFLATICDATGLSLADVMAANQEKLAKRYPNGTFSPEASIARADVELQPQPTGKTDPYLWESGE